jgi:hypothetical protein
LLPGSFVKRRQVLLLPIAPNYSAFLPGVKG